MHSRMDPNTNRGFCLRLGSCAFEIMGPQGPTGAQLQHCLQRRLSDRDSSSRRQGRAHLEMRGSMAKPASRVVANSASTKPCTPRRISAGACTRAMYACSAAPRPHSLAWSAPVARQQKKGVDTLSPDGRRTLSRPWFALAVLSRADTIF